MFTLKSFVVPTLAFCAFSLTALAEPQGQTPTGQQPAQDSTDKVNVADITPPKPLDNPVFESMVGTWKSENNMLGMKTNSELKVRWGINHQYLLMHLEAEGAENSKFKYEGLGILGISGKGPVKAWWFDSWGADAVSTGYGKFEGNKLVLNDMGEMFKEVRSIEVKGDQMIMHTKGTMTLDKGKKTNFDETVVYKKK